MPPTKTFPVTKHFLAKDLDVPYLLASKVVEEQKAKSGDIMAQGPNIKGKKLNKGRPINLNDWADFGQHEWVRSLHPRFEKDEKRGAFAISQILQDLKEISELGGGRQHFVSIEARVKSSDSFFRKLFDESKSRAQKDGLTPKLIEAVYQDIGDLCGARVSCAYFDEIIPAVQNIIRPNLMKKGYGVELHQENPKLADQDFLDVGNQHGYRSYHLFVRIPTIIDIYGNVEPTICELQVRSELQHVWAVKSHDLLYKPNIGWTFSDNNVIEDMRQVSNSLRAADQHLISVRDRVKGKGV